MAAHDDFIGFLYFSGACVIIMGLISLFAVLKRKIWKFEDDSSDILIIGNVILDKDTVNLDHVLTQHGRRHFWMCANPSTFRVENCPRMLVEYQGIGIYLDVQQALPALLRDYGKDKCFALLLRHTGYFPLCLFFDDTAAVPVELTEQMVRERVARDKFVGFVIADIMR